MNGGIRRAEILVVRVVSFFHGQKELGQIRNLAVHATTSRGVRSVAVLACLAGCCPRATLMTSRQPQAWVRPLMALTVGCECIEDCKGNTRTPKRLGCRRNALCFADSIKVTSLMIVVVDLLPDLLDLLTLQVRYLLLTTYLLWVVF